LKEPRHKNTKDAAKSKSAIRIALLDIELDSKKDAARRLDRIGAEYEMIPPNEPLARLREFEVVYFSRGWGTLSGLASLAETYREYVEGRKGRVGSRFAVSRSPQTHRRFGSAASATSI
jgi:hypothetical protein